MFNLVYNELYKIFKRKRTMIPFVVIAILVIGLGLVSVKYFPSLSGDWKTEYTERTAEIEKNLGVQNRILSIKNQEMSLLKSISLK